MKINILHQLGASVLLLSVVYSGVSTITGTITNFKTGEPLYGANVMLEGSTLGSASDENGNYLITNVPIGGYTLRVMFIGYENMGKKIWIEGDLEYTINIPLKFSSIKLKETRVSAESRKEKITSAPAAMDIVTSRDIKQKSAPNLGAYLKGLKGVDYTSSGIGNYSINVRGFNSSFNTRLLALSDGRVANLPALRILNFSTIPSSMEDIEKIEVILGPTTALYGANAHSGVINIISKPPSQSEGLTMSLSGSNDERQLQNMNGRFAKKLTHNLSMKVSGYYLHAYDWPYISEEEYKTHLYPWVGAPYRTQDGKDNNPWNSRSESSSLKYEVNNYGSDGLDNDNNGIIDDEQGIPVLIGNGEAMNTGDPDGDGVMGEDWYNGYDDDGDGLVDEDYFTANGIDDDGDGEIDEGIDYLSDIWFDGVDNDNNGIIDDEASAPEANISNWAENIENNILIFQGRKDSLVNNNVNPYYLSNTTLDNLHIFGTHRFNEEKINLEFDIFIYDFGTDGLPGDPFIDEAGDDLFQVGEKSYYTGEGTIWRFDDCGLDGLCNGDPGYSGPDAGEDNDIWDPRDGWIDVNNNNIVDPNGVDGYTTNLEDVWPPLNGSWDEDEIIYDCGNDGYCWNDSWIVGVPHQAIDIDGNQVTKENGEPIWIYGPDPGEKDGKRAYDSKENDGIFDTGDGIYLFPGEDFNDSNGNGVWNEGETFIDQNNDGRYTPPDLIDNYQFVADNNGDGHNDYPDFEIDRRGVELRIDYDPAPDFNMTFQYGYSSTKTQLVTGTGRYLADGFESTFYQLRSRYKSWFSQIYLNQSLSDDTHGYNLGNRIIDKSKNYAFQIQHNFATPSLHTKFVWGMDYFKTVPYTNGTIINDGPNGYDNDGDNIYIKSDGVDNDLDGLIDDNICTDGKGPGFRNGIVWNCDEGIDEQDEFIDPVSNEYGLYYQTSTELFGTSRFELITAARLDYHDLLEEGLLFAPKFGFIHKPDSKSSMRFTYGKAYNTPNSITLFTDMFLGSVRMFDIYLRGNQDGSAYCRVGKPCLDEGYATSVVTPGFYSEDGKTFYKLGPQDNSDYFEGYNERVNGAPYFFKFGVDEASILAGDMVPLDTSQYVIFIPELNDDGVLYTPEESFNLPDVEPIRPEKIQTIEFGYKGFIGNKTHITMDYYLSYYEDFFSPPTIITPWVVQRVFDEDGNDITNIDDLDIHGMMTINDFGTHPPYGTAWNGLDDDDDWEIWADEFKWRGDNNGDGNDADPGEWGFVLWDSDSSYTIYHPYEVLREEDGWPTILNDDIDNSGGVYDAVGVDEWHRNTGLAEYEPVQTGLIDGNGDPIIGGGNADAPYHVVLSPMNYGEVWMQGLDVGITHILSNKLIMSSNFSWYGTTEYYNELTKKNDPINAPKFKWNSSIKWNSSLGDIIVNFRHVDRFKWSDGIWLGFIGPYNIVDLFYTYQLTKNLIFNLSALNINNDLHRELVGGAIMGRQIVMRFTSTF